MPTTVKLGSTGPDVSLLQQKLGLLGTKLVVDGDFGPKTESAVKAFQQAHYLIVDGICGPTTWATLDTAVRMLDPVMIASAPANVEWHDRRKYAAQAHGPNHEWPVTDRPIEKVTGVCLHQTACLLGERVERYDTVGAHFAVTRAGKGIWLHDFDRQVAAANGWNNGTVSIEIDGLYAGVEGDPSTVWDDPSTPNREQAMVLPEVQICAVNELLRWIQLTLGAQMNVIVAHRQSSGSRRNDPGSAIWKACALPMHGELGCTDGGIGFKLDDGKPIPEAWDPRCSGFVY